MLNVTRDPWAILLAGGEGSRLRPLTERVAGDGRPKQFCAILDGETLLEGTRCRVTLAIRPDRQVVSVTRHHADWCDLGTSPRVVAALRRTGRRPDWLAETELAPSA